MKPTRAVSRRSFLRRVSGAALGGGALLAIAGRAAAFQVTDNDHGPGHDPVGGGRRGPSLIKAGDSDFAEPRLMGDVVHSDPAPGRLSGITDSDRGPAADIPGYGAGEARQEAQAARCAAIRLRIDRLEGLRPRSAEIEESIATLRAHLERWGCN